MLFKQLHQVRKAKQESNARYMSASLKPQINK